MRSRYPAPSGGLRGGKGRLSALSTRRVFPRQFLPARYLVLLTHGWLSSLIEARRNRPVEVISRQLGQLGHGSKKDSFMPQIAPPKRYVLETVGRVRAISPGLQHSSSRNHRPCGLRSGRKSKRRQLNHMKAYRRKHRESFLRRRINSPKRIKNRRHYRQTIATGVGCERDTGGFVAGGVIETADRHATIKYRDVKSFASRMQAVAKPGSGFFSIGATPFFAPLRTWVSSSYAASLYTAS